MAHIVVYLQRTPQGLHPASAVGVCLARDIGSQRGATVTAVCRGDAGGLDRSVVTAAGRFGADVVVFGGPNALDNLQRRLRPVHVLTPWTPEGLTAVQGLRGGPTTPRWLQGPDPEWGQADTITGLIAGTVPWHDFDAELEAEFEGDVDQAKVAAWVEEAAGETDLRAPSFQIAGFGSVGYVAPEGLDESVRDQLQALGAEPTTPQYAASAQQGTFLWLSPGAGPLPDEVGGRGPAARLLLLPGPDATVDPTWSLADWVIGGPWPDVIAQLREAATEGGPWQTGPA